MNNRDVALVVKLNVLSKIPIFVCRGWHVPLNDGGVLFQLVMVLGEKGSV